MNRPADLAKILLAAFLLAPAVAPTLAAAQPEPASPDMLDRDRPRETIRARLERRLEQARAVVTRLERAIAALDEGRSPRDIEMGLRGQDRELRRDRARAPRETVLAFIAEHIPELATSLEALEASRPGAAEAVMRRIGPRVAEVLRTREPELRALRTREFVVRYRIFEAERAARRAMRDDDNAAAQTLEQTLRTLAGEQHDIRRDIARLEIATIERRLAELRTTLERTDADREAFIERTLKEIRAGRGPR